MNFLSFGARDYKCQLPRIIVGLHQLGWTEKDHNVQFIYANDKGGYKEALLAKARYPAAKLILNVLDIPHHLPNLLDICREYSLYLSKADIITCISESVQKDLLYHFNFQSSVIYNPAKEIINCGYAKQLPFLMVGRVCDPNKRAILAYKVHDRMKENIGIVGSENPGFGKYVGEVSDEKLNLIYNVSEFVFAFGKVEGIGLQIPEAIMADAVPIALNDCPASVEFCPPEFLAYPDVDHIIERIQWCRRNKDKVKEILQEYRSKYIVMFNHKTIAQNIINLL